MSDLGVLREHVGMSGGQGALFCELATEGGSSKVQSFKVENG